MNLCFAVQVTVNERTGSPISVYFQVRRGRVHETREFADGAAFADYAKNGSLLGIELLSPCRATIVDQLATNELTDVRRETKRFMKTAGPRQLVAA